MQSMKNMIRGEIMCIHLYKKECEKFILTEYLYNKIAYYIPIYECLKWLRNKKGGILWMEKI